MKYIIHSIEHVYDGFDEYEHTNEIQPVIIDASSIEDASKKGHTLIQDKVTDLRRQGGYLSTGDFVIEIKSIALLKDDERVQYSMLPDKLVPGLEHYNNSKDLQKLKVFLCYASEDKKKIREIYHRLKNSGFEPWLDEINILPGLNWDSEIKKAVRSSNVVILCMSKHSTNKEGYVQKEIKQILDIADEKPDNTIFIIPLKLEECIIPDRLSQLQFVSYDDSGFAKVLQSLIKRKEQIENRRQ